MPLQLQTIPCIDFQPDAIAVFDDVAQGTVQEEDVWVSCYETSRPSVHGKVRLSKDSSDSSLLQGVGLRARDGIAVERRTHKTFSVRADLRSAADITVRFPRQSVVPPDDGRTALSAPLDLNCVDVNSRNTHIVYGGPDGYCRVTALGDPIGKSDRIKLQGHVGDVLDARWFPSGEVVLTSSSDATLRIFSAIDGSNPRTLKGHKRAVTSTAILGVGRNVVSGSKDGSVRLWDVSSGKSLASMYTEGFAGVEAIAVDSGAASIHAAQATEPPIAEREVVGDTRDKLVFAGLSKSAGLISVFDLRSRGAIFSAISHVPQSADVTPSLRGGAIHAIAYDADKHLLASGSSKGVVAIKDIRMLSSDPSSDHSTPRLLMRNQAGINDIKFAQSATAEGIDLVLAGASGLPCRLHLPSSADESASVVEEYAGWEAVPISSISVGSGTGNVWLAGGEAGLRRY